MGYEVQGQVYMGLKLHVPSSPEYATITQIKEGRSAWELVKYNYCPSYEEAQNRISQKHLMPYK